MGTWRLQVTPVFCPGVTTGTLAAPFQGLVSFTGDGTLTNTFTNALFGYDTPGQASALLRLKRSARSCRLRSHPC